MKLVNNNRMFFGMCTLRANMWRKLHEQHIVRGDKVREMCKTGHFFSSDSFLCIWLLHKFSLLPLFDAAAESIPDALNKIDAIESDCKMC